MQILSLLHFLLVTFKWLEVKFTLTEHMKYTELVYYVLVITGIVIGVRTLLALFFLIPGSENVTVRIAILVALLIAFMYAAYRIILWSLD